MRVAVFMRGPFRPDFDSGLARARALADEVRSKGDEPTLFFATWMLEDRTFLQSLIEQPDVRHALTIEPPPDELIYGTCGIEHLPNGKAVRNVFYQYYLSKIGLQVLDSLGRFDFVIHSRPDMDMRFGSFYEQWFEKGSYSTLHFRDQEGEGFINDQIGVATTTDMLRVWDYGSLDNLGKLIRNSKIPEDTLDQMFETSGVKKRGVNFEIWNLDRRRFD